MSEGGTADIQAAVEATPPKRLTPGGSLSALRDYGIVVAFVVLFVTLAFASDAFFTQRNIVNILFQAAPVGIMACGGTLVFIAGGFDLSVGAVAAIAGVVAATTADDVGVVMALTLGALVGLGFGIFNGLLTTIGRINAFIATLASSIIIRGLALAITGGFLVSVDDQAFYVLGNGEFAGVRYPVFVWLGFALFCGFLLWRTQFGRYVYAAGGNAEAARLSGVRVGLVRGTTFAISGLSGGLAGIILTSQIGTGQADANLGIEFDAIAAIIIGGTSILGGEGAIWRSVLGALLFQLISNGFNLMNVQPVYQRVFLGVIMLVAVAIDAWARRTRSA
jgi:ribose transport system permease protein